MNFYVFLIFFVHSFTKSMSNNKSKYATSKTSDKNELELRAAMVKASVGGESKTDYKLLNTLS